jgi:hypothetical protein
MPKVMATGYHTDANGIEEVEVMEHTDDSIVFRYFNSEDTLTLTNAEWAARRDEFTFAGALYGNRFESAY